MAWASKLLFEINLSNPVLFIKEANCLTGKFKQAGKELREWDFKFHSRLLSTSY